MLQAAACCPHFRSCRVDWMPCLHHVCTRWHRQPSARRRAFPPRFYAGCRPLAHHPRCCCDESYGRPVRDFNELGVRAVPLGRRQVADLLRGGHPGIAFVHSGMRVDAGSARLCRRGRIRDRGIPVRQDAPPRAQHLSRDALDGHDRHFDLQAMGEDQAPGNEDGNGEIGASR